MKNRALQKSFLLTVLALGAATGCGGQASSSSLFAEVEPSDASVDSDAEDSPGSEPDAELAPDAPDAPEAEAEVGPDAPDAPEAEAEVGPDAPDAPEAEAEVGPDAPEAEAEAGCPETSKLCSGQCVDLHAPATGCAAVACAPCSFPNGTATCSPAGTCALAACLPEFGDCDKDGTSGCEVNILSDPWNCGTCGNVCVIPHASAACVSGKCAIGFCNAGFLDCDLNPANGCETTPTSDGKNCGACGHDCFGGTCTNGKCGPVVIASGQPEAWSIAVDDTHAYWTTWVNPGVVRRVPITGGAVQDLATGQKITNGIALNSTHVYWASEGSGVYRSTKDGSSGPVLLWPGTQPIAVSATDSVLVWDTWDGAIWRANPDGTAATKVAAGNQNPNRIVTDGTDIYWVNWTGGQVRSVPLGGGFVTEIATGQSGGLSVAVDGTHVFWTTEWAGSNVMRANKGGGQLTVMAGSQNKPIALALDSTHVYFASSNGGTVRRMLKDGPPQNIETIASGQGTPVFMALDATSVYWSNQKSGTIMRLAK